MERMKRTVLLMLIFNLVTGQAYSQNILRMDPGKYHIGGSSFSGEGALAPEKATISPATDNYQVGVDDVLDVTIIKPEQLQTVATVAPDGTVTVPYIGNVQVKGMSLPEIQDDVQKRLSSYVEFPIVSVSLRQSRSKKYTVYGQVNRPGAYPVSDGMTLLHAITDASGFLVPDSTGRVRILRPKDNSKESEVIETNVSSILSGKDQNIAILPGDTVVVSMDKFFIYGQVIHPGAYPVQDGMSILHAVTVAGGFIESGSAGKVKLFRSNPKGDKPQVIESDIKSILNGANQNIVVQQGDTIVVSLDKFYISGQVNRPGAYPIEENMSLLSAITQAGGFSESTTNGKIKLMRLKSSPEKGKVTEIDVKAVLNGTGPNIIVEQGDTIVVSLDKFYISGQVNRPGAYAIEENMTLLNAVTQAGGFSESAANGKVKLLRAKVSNSEPKVTEVDVKDLLSGESPNIVVLPGDSIVVSADKFFVYGEVNRPGIYPLEANTTVLTAITMAGGFTKYGSASKVKILRANKDSKEVGMYQTIKVNINDVTAGDSDEDIVLEPRDIVVISESAF